MSINGYQIAIVEATNEIAEINAELEKLTQRKNLIEKLLGVLKDVATQSESFDASATIPHAPAAEVPATDAATDRAAVHEAAVHKAETHDIAAHKSPEANAAAHSAPAAELHGDGAAAKESPPPTESPTPVSSAAERLYEWAESEPEPEARRGAVLAAGNGRPSLHERVAQLAYRFWTERCYVHGYNNDDWFRAERELLGVGSLASASP